jgi:hypothetical protein
MKPVHTNAKDILVYGNALSNRQKGGGVFYRNTWHVNR